MFIGTSETKCVSAALKQIQCTLNLNTMYEEGKQSIAKLLGRIKAILKSLLAGLPIRS